MTRTVILGPTGVGVRTVNIAGTGPAGLWETCGQTAGGPTGLFETVQASAEADNKFKSLIIPGYTGGGGGGYVAKAVHFDGSTYLTIPSLSCLDNGLYSCSCWLNPSDLSNNPMVFITDPNSQFGPYFNISSLGALRYFLCNTGDANDFSFKAGDGTVLTGTWKNFLFTANVNLPDPDKILVLYINDVLVTNTGSSSDIAFTIASNALSFLLGSDTQGENYIGDMADMWVAPGVSLLTDTDISVATRRLFIDGSGKPVNPTSFPGGGAVLCSGDATTFANNQLGGGTFVTTGTLTNATTSPSD